MGLQCASWRLLGKEPSSCEEAASGRRIRHTRTRMRYNSPTYRGASDDVLADVHTLSVHATRCVMQPPSSNLCVSREPLRLRRTGKGLCFRQFPVGASTSRHGEASRRPPLPRQDMPVGALLRPRVAPVPETMHPPPHIHRSEVLQHLALIRQDRIRKGAPSPLQFGVVNPEMDPIGTRTWHA